MAYLCTLSKYLILLTIQTKYIDSFITLLQEKVTFHFFLTDLIPNYLSIAIDVWIMYFLYITETGSYDTLKILKEHHYVLKLAQFLRAFPAWFDLGSFMHVQTLSLVLSERGSDWCQGF